jgi:hypothetical protein
MRTRCPSHMCAARLLQPTGSGVFYEGRHLLPTSWLLLLSLVDAAEYSHCECGACFLTLQTVYV